MMEILGWTINKKQRDGVSENSETRGLDMSWRALKGGYIDYSDALKVTDKPTITAQIAENLATVTAAISAISGALSSLPVMVFRRLPKGREAIPDHPLMKIIREGPNDQQSWPEFIESVMRDCLLNGNGLIELITAQGRVAGLKFIPWRNVTPVLLPSKRLAFDILPMNTIQGVVGEPRRLLQSEVIHLKDVSDDGYIGRSRLSRCAGPFLTALTQEAHGEFLYANRAAPSGMFSFEGNVSQEQAERLRDQVRQLYGGVKATGNAIVAGSGMKYSPIEITPESLEMLAARRFSTEEIARIFSVPPPIIGIWDHSTFTNSETAGRWFAQFCLAPWIRKLEEAFCRGVFAIEERQTCILEFDMSGFLRGDAEARWNTHQIAVDNNILTTNEIREMEGWNPVDSGDQFTSGGEDAS